MIDEIEETADLLETDYDNPKLDEVKKNFSIYYMCSRDDVDNINGNDAAIPNHVPVVVDFYRRFAKRLRKMMYDNPFASAISISGP